MVNAIINSAKVSGHYCNFATGCPILAQGVRNVVSGRVLIYRVSGPLLLQIEGCTHWRFALLEEVSCFRDCQEGCSETCLATPIELKLGLCSGLGWLIPIELKLRLCSYRNRRIILLCLRLLSAFDCQANFRVSCSRVSSRTVWLWLESRDKT